MDNWEDDIDIASMMEAISPLSWPSPPSSSTPPTATIISSTAAATSQPSKAASSSSSALFLNQVSLQERLLMLIGGARESWTYAIFWQSSVDVSGASSLGWGDGYYAGEREEDQRKRRKASSAAIQEHRQSVLRDLFSLVSGGEASDDAIDEEVTDTEWFFLVSMTQSFSNGTSLPGQAFFAGFPTWVSGGEQLAGGTCERAHQAHSFGLQTMVWIPFGNGAVELGSTEHIFYSSDLINKAKILFSFDPVEAGGQQAQADQDLYYNIMMNGQRKKKQKDSDAVVCIEDEVQEYIDEDRDIDMDKRRENCYEEKESHNFKRTPLWDEVKVLEPARTVSAIKKSPEGYKVPSLETAKEKLQTQLDSLRKEARSSGGSPPSDHDHNRMQSNGLQGVEIDVKVLGWEAMIKLQCSKKNHPTARLMAVLMELDLEVSYASVSVVNDLMIQQATVKMASRVYTKEQLILILLSILSRHLSTVDS